MLLMIFILIFSYLFIIFIYHLISVHFITFNPIKFLTPVFPHGGPPRWELCLVCPQGRRLGDPAGLEDRGGLCTRCGVYPGLFPGWGGLCGGAPCGRGLGHLLVWMATHRWFFPYLDPHCLAMSLVYFTVWVCVCV